MKDIPALRTVQARIRRAAQEMDKIHREWAWHVYDTIRKNGYMNFPAIVGAIGFCCSDICGGRIPAVVDDGLTPTIQEYNAGLTLRYHRLWYNQMLKRIKG